MDYCYTYELKKFKLTLVASTTYLKKIIINDDVQEDYIKEEIDIIKKSYEEIKEYLDGKRKSFDIPFALEGTKFQKKVWLELLKIPYGEIITYKELAQRINNPKAVRAVGGACNRNPLAIIIPCHRVVGSNGKLVGYRYSIELKKYLLDLELTSKS